MKRMLFALALAAGLGAAAYGAAALLVVNGGTIQSGIDASLACDTNGITVDSYMVNDIYSPEGVVALRVKGVDPACVHARIYAVVRGAGGAALAVTDARPQYGSVCYATQNWAIGQLHDPTLGGGGYVLNLMDTATRAVYIGVNAADIESVQFYIEGYDSAALCAEVF